MKMKKNFLALTLAILIVAAISGCGQKVTVTSLCQDLVKNTEAVKSLEADMDMVLKAAISGDSDGVQVSMDIDMAMAFKMQQIIESGEAYVNGNMDISMMGFNVATDMEIYNVKEDGKIVSYTKVQDTWTKNQDTDDSDINGSVESIFKQLADEKVQATLEEKTETIDEKEVYVIKADLKSGDVKGLVNSLGDSMDDLTGTSLDNADGVIPFTLYVDKNEKLPVKLSMDLSGLGDAMFSQQEGAKATVEEFSLNILFTGFDTVESIQLPEEAKENAISAGSGNNILGIPGGEEETEAPQTQGETDETPFSGSTGTDAVMDDAGNYVLSSYDDTVTIALTTPEGTDFAYGSPTYLSFTSDPVDFTYGIDDYTDDADMVSEYSSADFMSTDEDYSNISTTEVAAITVNGMEIHYFSDAYTFMEDMGCRDYYAWTTLADGYKLVCEIEVVSSDATEPAMDTSIIEAAFNVIVPADN